MPAVAGLRGTGDWGADERPKNFREAILWMKPNGSTPLNALMSKMSSESVDDPEFSWWEEDLGIIQVTLNDGTGMAAGDVATVIDAGGLDLVVDDVLLVETGDNVTYDNELVRVAAVTDDQNITLERGYAGSTAATIADNTVFTRIGTSFAEGTDAPGASTRNPVKYFNFCQIFKTVYELTETVRVTKSRTGSAEKNDKKRKMHDHSYAQEYSWIFGKRWEGVGSNGKPKRTTGGLRYFLASQNREHIFGAALTSINEFIDNASDVFDYTGDGDTGGDERLVLCGNGLLIALSKLAATAGQVNFGEIVKVYGMSLPRLVTPQGTFYFKSHPLLNIHSAYRNSGFIIDPPGLNYRHLRDTKSKDNIQGNGEDSKKGQWITEAGLEAHHMKTMKYIGNVTV